MPGPASSAIAVPLVAMSLLAGALLCALSCGGQIQPSGSTVDAGSGATGGAATGGASVGGGVAVGGNSASGGAGGAGGGSGGVTNQCSGAQCPSYMLGGIVLMAGCCGPNNRCGALLKNPANDIIGGIPQGCYESDQVGNLDCDCPAFSYGDPTKPGTTTTFPGCCTSLGSCGYVIDLMTLEGPTMGCQVANWGAGQGKTCVPKSGLPCK